ncbi:FAD-dependent oxidoreductase [Halovivax gelatinilyticus]|uniref:FAD-dependent oxidoreductase n=1 Tax=Halovivax gelatinilyticus TaxID=2961597 RepID=UPI0020CA3C84|nr:FAD-dependent oxidoreductase [Halovivax gelatinilyticus]
MSSEDPRAGALPGLHASPWLAASAEPFEPLSGSTSTEVAIVGAGIAGLSTAAELVDRGYDVAVLERDRVGSGITGKSTAKVTSQHGLVYAPLCQEFGLERATQYARANQRAIETVEERVDALDVAEACGFRRRPAYVYGDDRGSIEREVDAAARIGLPASFVTSVPPYEPADCGVRFDDQACVDPRRYVHALAASLVEDGGSVFEQTRVTGVDTGEHPSVGTERGRVSADRVVLTTGFPIVDRLGLFARLTPKRSYVLALRIDGEPPEGMYYRPAEGASTYRSVRTHEGPDETLVLVGGENHKTGQGGSTRERYRRLAAWARDRFDVREVAYRWSTQDYVSADRVPLVGPAGPGARNVFIATGFGGWGMTGSTVAGRLLARLIDGEDPEIASLYDPRRFTPHASIGRVAVENADAAGQFASDWVRSLLGSTDPAVEPGEGTVVRRGGRPIAVSRDDSGSLRAVSAVCPHAYCVVDWNDGEETWDCPCHGSRFGPDGRVLEGPASEDLSRTEFEGS